METETLKNEILRRANLEYVYLDQIRLALHNQCQKNQTISTSAFFYNLAQSNWVYGANVTSNDLTASYFQLS